MPTALKKRTQTIESLLADIEWTNKQIEFRKCGVSEPKKAKVSFEEDDDEEEQMEGIEEEKLSEENGEHIKVGNEIKIGIEEQQDGREEHKNLIEPECDKKPQGDEEEAGQQEELGKDGVEEEKDHNEDDDEDNDEDNDDDHEDQEDRDEYEKDTEDEYEERNQQDNEEDQEELTKVRKEDPVNKIDAKRDINKSIIDHRKLIKSKFDKNRERLGEKSKFDKNVDEDDDDHDDNEEEDDDHDDDEKVDDDHGDDEKDEYEEGNQQDNEEDQEKITKVRKEDPVNKKDAKRDISKSIIDHRKLRERLGEKSKFDQTGDEEDKDEYDDDHDEDYNHGDDEKDDDDGDDDDEEDDDEEEDDDHGDDEEEDDDNHGDDDEDDDHGDDEDGDKYEEGNQQDNEEDQEKRTKVKKEVHIKNKDAKRDINNNKIYYRKLLKCKFGRNGARKKRETVWNQAHACKFCGLIKTNISKHLRTHKIQREIKDLNSMINSLGKKHKHVKAKWDLLRGEGDHKHNLKVLQEGEGEIILARRSHEHLDISEYGPCPGCFAWLKMGKTLVTHQKKCPANVLCGNQSDFIKLTKKELHVRSLEAANKLSSVASRALIQEVFTIMTNDKISEIAKSDSLIICLGNLWLLKNVGNRLKRKYYASARMRDAGRYLIHLRNETGCSKHSMEEFLRPEYFDFLVRCALLTASPQFDDEEDLKSPSTALKIGYDLKRMIAAKWAEAIKTKNPEKVAQCKDLFKLIKFEWSIKVTKLATTTLTYRRFNKEHSLPEADDLCKLQQHIKEEIKQLNLKDSSYSNYRRVGVLAETRILLFNKRRSGEVEAMRVSEYLRRKDVSNIEKSMREGLTALENHLLTSQDLIEVRGKNGRGVPVIVPSDTKALLKYLAHAENRSNAGMFDSNRYLFPNARHGVLRAYDSLKSLCKEIELTKPHKITSVNMRKYTATIAQIFDLNPNQQQWLLNHLGHSMDVHKIHYRQTSGLIERIDMAKLMLMQELNLTAKYAGKKLAEIQLDEIVFNHTVDDCDVSTQDLTEALDLDSNINVDDDFQPAMNDVGKDEFSFTDDEDDEDDDYDHRTKKTRSTNVKTRVRWNKDEESDIKKFFQEYFETKTTPGRDECEKVIAKSTFLKKRSWETLKKKVWNMMKKM